MKILFVITIISGLLSAQDGTPTVLQLKNGDKISGSVVSENDSAVVMMTSFGQVTIPRSSIKPLSITVYLKDGNILSGDVITKTSGYVVLSTAFGVVTINHDNIDRTTEEGVAVPGTAQEEEFYYSKERLLDIFFDPTGYTMEKGSIYFSGLSWGVALSENVEISSAYYRYFFADLNIRPKFKLYSSGTLESEHSLAAGFHLHSAGPTGKQQPTTVSVPVYGNFGGITGYEEQKEWNAIGDIGDYFFWSEIFAAYTISTLKENSQGRVSYHAGASVIFHRVKTMPRAWIAVENDITSRFKIIGQVYYDPYLPSYREKIQNSQTKNPFDLDFGFVYVHNESLRVGIHYQPYIVLFYFKF